MSENRRDHVASIFTFDAVVQRVDPASWDAPSPCGDWTARQVVSHLVFILPMWIGEGPPDGTELGQCDHDPAITWVQARDRHLESIDGARLDDIVATNMGPLSLDASLGVLFVDPLIHAWDLGQAVGVAPHLPDRLCEKAHATLLFARDLIDNMFEPAIDNAIPHESMAHEAIPQDSIPPESLQDRMLRMSGRNPHRTEPPRSTTRI